MGCELGLLNSEASRPAPGTRGLVVLLTCLAVALDTHSAPVALDVRAD